MTYFSSVSLFVQEEETFMVLFHMDNCPACKEAKKVLKASGVTSIVYIDVRDDANEAIVVGNSISSVPTAVIVSPKKRTIYPFIEGYDEALYGKFIDGKY